MNLLPKLFLRAQSVLFNPARTVFKSDLKIRWKRPQKVKFYHPSKTGDRAVYKQQDRSEICRKFAISEELKTADENVKKLFTLGFQAAWRSNQNFKATTEDLVRRHNLDAGSLEVLIAKYTADIRYLQELIPKLPKRCGALNKRLHLRIGKRQKFLSRLRHRDYKRYEWLLERLELSFKPPPKERILVCRKEGLRKLTNIHCEGIKMERLTEYRKQLESQQEEFLMKKLENLKFIRNEQKSLGMEVTVSQKSIDGVNEKYLELKHKREEEEKNQDKSRKWKMY